MTSLSRGRMLGLLAWTALLGLEALLAPIAWGQETAVPAELFRRAREGDASALAALQKSAQAGDAEGQFQLGRAYSFGSTLLKRDDPTALKWVEKAAVQGHAEAQSNLGYLYSVGLGAEKNPDKAIQWWQRSAEAGFVQAQYNLAMAFLEGNLVRKDADKAFYWMQRAASQGAAIAQVTFGMMHGRGIGTKADSQEALNWYRKAAEQGNEIAMINIGSMYANGEAVARDPVEALRWLEKPVASGDSRAIAIRERICGEHAGLCPRQAQTSGFAFRLSDPKIRISIPGLPAMEMKVHPLHASKPHLRYLGSDGGYTVSILTPTADAGMTARECAVSEFKALEKVPGAPPPDKIYKARIDDNTYLAIYAFPVADMVMLNAHLVSAAGGTHCVQAHASRISRSKDDVDPWYKAFSKARFEPE